MKAFIILWLFGASLAISGANESTDSEEIARNVERDMAILRDILKEDWTIKSKGNEIILTSKFDVFLINLISRREKAPEFSDNTPRKELLKEGASEKYVINLRYKIRMSQEEYDARTKERRKIIERMRAGVNDADERSDLYQQYVKLKMPRYRDWHDIYEELPYEVGVRIYPPRACQKVGGAKMILEDVLVVCDDDRVFPGKD